MALEGSALAVNDADCENNDGYYAIIDKVITNAKWFDNLASLVASPATYADYVAEITLQVYGVYANGARKLIAPEKLKVTAPQGAIYAAGKVTNIPTAGGDIKIEINDAEYTGTLSTTVTIPAQE